MSIANDQPQFPLFEYQEKAVNYMIKAKGGVLVSPCGSGKTIMGIELMKRIGKKSLWICHTGDLLRQAKDDILALYPNAKVSLTTNGKVDIGDDITVATIQTLDRIDKSLYENEFDVVIIDECVHCVSSPTQMTMFGRVLSKIKARYKFGLTATPKRSDGLSYAMYAYIGTSMDGKFKPTYEVDKNEVKKIAAVHRKYDISSGYDKNIDKIRQLYDSSGRINYNKLIQTLVENDERNEKIAKKIEDCYLKNRKQVVLSHRVEHCKKIVQMLCDKNIKAVLCVGEVSDKKRKQILNQEEEWDVLVATYSLLKEGVSVKELDTLHMLTPVSDDNMVIQCAGRIERYLENKKQPKIYDYVDIDIPYCVKKYDKRRRALNRR